MQYLETSCVLRNSHKKSIKYFPAHYFLHMYKNVFEPFKINVKQIQFYPNVSKTNINNKQI